VFPVAPYFFAWSALQVLTLGVILADRALLRRAAKPKLAAVLVLSAILNPVALPYYFGKSRGTFLGVVAGITFFLVVFVIVIFAMAKLWEAGLQ
jgi:hypothetical protein